MIMSLERNKLRTCSEQTIKTWLQHEGRRRAKLPAERAGCTSIQDADFTWEHLMAIKAIYDGAKPAEEMLEALAVSARISIGLPLMRSMLQLLGSMSSDRKAWEDYQQFPPGLLPTATRDPPAPIGPIQHWISYGSWSWCKDCRTRRPIVHPNGVRH